MNPSPDTFPVIGKVLFAFMLSEKKYEYHFKFLIKAKNRERWLLLRECLGEEYMNELRKQCCYKMAA